MGLYTELIDPSNRNLKFTKFCSEIEQQFVGNQSGLKLNSFLILPVQRLPRYEMLLRDITKHTWKSHPDLPSLTKALAGIAEVTAFLNESKRTNENMSRMIEIRNKLAGQTIQNVFIYFFFILLFFIYFLFFIFKSFYLFILHIKFYFDRSFQTFYYYY